MEKTKRGEENGRHRQQRQGRQQLRRRENGEQIKARGQRQNNKTTVAFPSPEPEMIAMTGREHTERREPE